MLEIALDSHDLHVSHLSSLLRVVQAVLREVARSGDDTRQAFSKRPQPMLLVSTCVAEGSLVLRFAFADPSDSAPLTELSSLTFGQCLELFARFLKELPQPGLWGVPVRSGRRQRHESDIMRRMDHLHVELRRFRSVRVGFDRHAVTFEGDRMEIR